VTATAAEHPPHDGEVDSLQELRPLHVALLQEWAGLDDARKGERAEGFRKIARAAGRWIKNFDERDSAQSLLDYWTATMAGLPGCESYPRLVSLADFDPATVQTSSKKSPYVGLNPFSIEDRDHFHGRDQVRDELLAASDANPLFVITGPSGLGKSSLVQAGLAGTLGTLPRWKLLAPATPGSDPVASLLRTVRPDRAPPAWLDDQRARIESDPDHLRVLAERDLPPDQGAVLVIDRAEEMFTFDVGNAEIGVAAAALAAFVAGPQPGRHRVILDIREDYFEQLSAGLKAAKLELATAAVARPRAPTREELAEAVVKPAEAVGLKFDPAVTEALVADLDGQADALPLLQFTLSKLWGAAETDRVGMAEYQAIGRPSLIVQNVAEGVYAALDSTEAQDTARLAFLALIRVGSYVSRRRLRRDDLREVLEKSDSDVSRLNPVLKAFDNAGLLRRTPGDSAGDDCFEIAHEAVIRNWPRLLIWLQDRRRGDDVRERVMASLERWRASGRRGSLLLRGQALREAAALDQDGGAVGEYIAASRRRQRVMRIALASLIVVLAAGALLWDALKRANERDLRNKQDAAISAAREETALGENFQRQAMLTDQALMRLVRKGALDEAAVPALFLERMRRRPTGFRAGGLGYDPNFLHMADDGDTAIAVPMPTARLSGARILTYPHATIIYDTQRRVPLVIATNYNQDAAPLPPFLGIGSFPDPRLDSALQYGERVSLHPAYGLVPLASFQEVGWAAGGGYRDTSFLHFAPFAVLRPWQSYLEAWSRIENRLLGLPARRIIFFTGPVLNGPQPEVGGLIVPQAYFKIAVYRDEASGELRVQAYVIDVNTPFDEADTRALRTVNDIEHLTGLDFGPLGDVMPDPSRPTVYLHYANMPNSTAAGIRRALSRTGHVLHGAERVAEAAGQHQVRYFHEEDKEAAETLALRAREALADAGFGDVQIEVKWIQMGRRWPEERRQAVRRVLELWIGVPPPATSQH
jgi:hypothetical protein